MLEGITEYQIEEGKRQCEEKFKQELLDLWKSASEYEIKTYDDFSCELRMLNERYLEEMEDFDDFPDDFILDSCYEVIEKAKNKMSLQVFALGHLELTYGIKSKIELDSNEIAIPFQIIPGGKQ